MCTHVKLSRPLRRRQMERSHGHANVCGLLGTKAACLNFSPPAKRGGHDGHDRVTPSLGHPASIAPIPRSLDRRDRGRGAVICT
jgi:hypothetical protein